MPVSSFFKIFIVKIGTTLFSVMWYLYIVFNYCLVRFKLDDTDNISPFKYIKDFSVLYISLIIDFYLFDNNFKLSLLYASTVLLGIWLLYILQFRIFYKWQAVNSEKRIIKIMTSSIFTLLVVNFVII